MGNMDGLIFRLSLLLAAAWVLWMTWPPEWSENARLPSSQVAYRTMPGKGPWVICLPGYWLNQQYLDDPAYELHRRGFSVATLDLNRTSDPTGAVAQLLARLPDASVYAHSGSVTPTVEAAARTGKARALVLLGFDPTGRRDRPPLPQVLLGFGKFDDYLSEQEMRRALASTGPSGKLFLSPASAHGGEPFDPILLEESARWLATEPLQPGGVPYALRHAAWMIAAAVTAPFLPAWGWALVGLFVPLAGAAGLLARGGSLVARHLAAAAGAGLVATWLLHPLDPSWALTVALTFVLYLPSECAGVLAERQPQHLVPLLLACWLPALPLPQQWLRRFTAFSKTRPVRFAGLVCAAAAFFQPLLSALPLYLLFSSTPSAGSPQSAPDHRAAP